MERDRAAARRVLTTALDALERSPGMECESAAGARCYLLGFICGVDERLSARLDALASRRGPR